MRHVSARNGPPAKVGDWSSPPVRRAGVAPRGILVRGNTSDGAGGTAMGDGDQVGDESVSTTQQTPPQARPDAQGGPPKRASRALVYVPGLDLGLTADKTVRGVVTRLQTACDQQAESRRATFRVHWYDAALKKDAVSTDKVATLLRKDGDEENAVIDVYSYAWSGAFATRWQAQNLFRRAARALLSLFGIGRFVRFFRSAGKQTPFGRMQLSLALVIAALMVLYSLTLLVAVGQIAYRAINENTPPSTTTTTTTTIASTGGSTTTVPAVSSGEKGKRGWPARWLDTIREKTAALAPKVAIIGAAIAALAPKVRRRFEGMGGALSAADAYVRVAGDRPQIVGGLVALIEHLSEAGYEDVTIVAYSFGSIVSLDALYPTTGEPVRSLDRVGTLVTIGSPFEFAEAIRRNWKEGRHARAGVPKAWVNIHSDIDLLGSDFCAGPSKQREAVKLGPAAAGGVVTPTLNHQWSLGIEPTWWNLLAFHGFLSHGLYWGSDERTDQNVFVEVVRYTYDDTPILA